MQFELHQTDQSDVLGELANSCDMWKCDAGTLVARQGDVPTSMLILASGTIGAYAHDGRQPVETHRMHDSGTCIGAASVLLGEPPKVSLSAITPVWLLRVPHRALSKAMRQDSHLCERLAYNLGADMRAWNAGESHMPSHLVLPSPVQGDGPFNRPVASAEDTPIAPRNGDQSLTVKVSLYGVHSLPSHVPLGFAQCDPTVFLELDGQRAHTASTRYTRQAGTEPQWNEDFIFTGVRGVDGRLSLTLCEVGTRGGVTGAPIGRGSVHVSELLDCRRFAGDFKLVGRKKVRLQDAQSDVVSHRDGKRKEAHAVPQGGQGREMRAQRPAGNLAGSRDDFGAKERANEVVSGGVLMLDISVDGLYYEGEEEFVDALRLMGCERYYLQLKKVGCVCAVECKRLCVRA
jgi:hypothetical protein